MRRMTVLAVLVLAALSCTREQLVEPEFIYRMEFVIDWDSMQHARVHAPELYRVRFYDPATKKEMVAATGGGTEMLAYPDGLDFAYFPGARTIMAHAFNAGGPQINRPEDLQIATLTSTAIKSPSGTVIAAPVHFLVGKIDECVLPMVGEGSERHVVRMTMRSPLDSWKVVVSGISNLLYASSITMVLEGQYEKMAVDGFVPEGRASVQFSGRLAGGQPVIDTDFCTFGVRRDSRQVLHLTIVDQANLTYTMSVDVTDQMTLFNYDHVIRLESDFTLSTMVPGGFEPTAEEWNTVHSHDTIR